MSRALNIFFVLGLILLIGLEIHPQWRKTRHQENLQLPLNSRYSDKTVDTFLNHSFGTANGESGRVVRKWNQDIRIKIHGEPDADDKKFLQANIRQLTPLLNSTKISIIDEGQEGANMHIHFIPRSQFSAVAPQYKPYRRSPSGFWWGFWNNDSELTQATLLLDLNTNTINRHNQLLRLLMGAVGLMSNFIGDKESVYASATLTAFSSLDLDRIQLLYETSVLCGMTKEQAQNQIQQASTLTPANTIEGGIHEKIR